MKFLCICQYGHSRSVCLTRALHHRGHEAVAIGARTSPSAISIIAEWSDTICLLEPHFISSVPDKFHNKCEVFNVGHDIWANPYNSELRSILDQMLDKYFLEVK